MDKISLKQMITQFSYGLDAVEADFLGVSKFHGKRVALYCIAIGRELDYSEKELFTMAGCALLHDNALTEYLLSERPGSKQEFNRRMHCTKGEENCSYFPFPSDASGLVLYHHEYADGTGAFGKCAGEYPQAAGIIAMADELDAKFDLRSMTAQKLETLHGFLQENRGGQFEEKLADLADRIMTPAFMALLRDEKINEAFDGMMPEVQVALSNAELIRIAGITAKIIDYKSSFTREHTMQIANKAWYMSDIYGYGEEMRAKIFLAAALHDLGKLFIPTAILEKPGKLTEEEFETIKSHAKYTWDCLHDVPGLEDIALWASNHHEKPDGTGYPFGKGAKELDFISRLIACLDIYQAVREARPYHPERSHHETMAILNEMAGRGAVDAGITADLDRHLGALEQGRAELPPQLQGLKIF